MRDCCKAETYLPIHELIYPSCIIKFAAYTRLMPIRVFGTAAKAMSEDCCVACGCDLNPRSKFIFTTEFNFNF
jgi:hypothetical protein